MPKDFDQLTRLVLDQLTRGAFDQLTQLVLDQLTQDALVKASRHEHAYVHAVPGVRAPKVEMFSLRPCL
jgi:hypothetical protein